MNKKNLLAILFLALALTSTAITPDNEQYNNFKVAVYARAYEVRQMNNLKWLESVWDEISDQVKVDKIYLETHRDLILVSDSTIEAAKKFFNSRGVKTAGGITLTVNEMNRFETFCYSNPEHRKKVKEIVEFTARHFDEIILDDFFFTDCKCVLCIKAKGNRTWTQFRLDQMTEAARELILNPAKKVNPKVKVVIKYPNWYEHFQGLGFNLETEPSMFDGIYTGNETRDPDAPGQHLQQYESYLVFRYFENLKPGGNGGGWVDTGGMSYIDRYAEQLWLTLFAKAPEVTLFDFRQLQRPLSYMDRSAWQDMNPSFNFDEMMKPVITEDGRKVIPKTIARAAGFTFETVDRFMGKIGNPVGINSYKPFQSSGEDFLQNYMGMIGVPMNIVPVFPEEGKMLFLTESAKFDPDIVDKIKSRLLAGMDVTITSGLLKALQGKGIEDIVELRTSDRKAWVKDFSTGWRGFFQSGEPILIPQIQYFTNDSWEDITSLDGAAGWPILQQARYADASFFVLTIPDNPADLYRLPSGILNRVRDVLTGEDLKFRIEAPSKVSLFVYDNNTFIIDSFLPEETIVRIVTGSGLKNITDLVTQVEIKSEGSSTTRIWGRKTDEKSYFDIIVKPHSYRVFKAD
jgi:hypothetical protein